MTARLSGVSDGVLNLVVSGLLTEKELRDVQGQMAEVMVQQKKVGILIIVEDFSGWDPGGAWDDFSFQDKFDAYVKKMAIIGDIKWKDLVLLFSYQGLRDFPIEYFEPADAAKARAWLATEA